MEIDIEDELYEELEEHVEETDRTVEDVVEVQMWRFLDIVEAANGEFGDE